MGNMRWAREAGFSAGFFLLAALIPFTCFSCPRWNPRCFRTAYQLVLLILSVLPNRKASALLNERHASLIRYLSDATFGSPSAIVRALPDNGGMLHLYLKPT